MFYILFAVGLLIFVLGLGMAAFYALLNNFFFIESGVDWESAQEIYGANTQDSED